MENIFFSGTAQIEIQGKRVLEFISLDKSEAKFKTIGLFDPVVFIVDSRPAVHQAMKRILKTGEVETLAKYFNTPAHITISEVSDQKTIVQLEPTQEKHPKHMLWVAIGIGDDIPYYDYRNIQIEQMDDGSFALFSLYKRPS